MIFDTGREGRLSNMLTLKCVTLKRQLNVLKHQLIIRDGGEEGGGGGLMPVLRIVFQYSHFMHKSAKHDLHPSYHQI